MTTDNVWLPIELTETMFQLLFNSYDNRRSMVFQRSKRDRGLLWFNSNGIGYAWLPKKLTGTILSPLFNSHNNKRSMISNSETLLHLLFNFHNNRQSMVFYIRNKDHAPAYVQLSYRLAKHDFQLQRQCSSICSALITTCEM